MPAAANTYDVVLRPFRELVKLGELATSYAAEDPDHENSAPLRAAAKTLSNEGARALKKLSPLLLSPSPDFSEFLIGLAVRHDETAPRFRDIDVLLYDFEDYIETDTFEKDKFDTLRGAVKDLAIILLDKVRTHTTEATLDDRPPPAAFPPLPPIPNTPPMPPKSPGLRRPNSRNRVRPSALPLNTALPPMEPPPRRTSHPESQSRMPPHPPSSKQRPTTFERTASYGDGGQLSPVWRPPTAISLPAAMNQLDISRVSMASSTNSGNLPVSPESPHSQTFSSAASTNWGNQSVYRSSVCTSVPETDYPFDDDEMMGPGPVKPIDAGPYGGYGGYQDYNPPQQHDLHHINAVRPMPEAVLRARGADTMSITSKRTTILDELTPDGSSDTTSTGYTPAMRSPSRASSFVNANRSSTKTDDANRVSVRSGSSSNRGRGPGDAFGPESSFGVSKGFCKGAQKFMSDGPGGAIKKVGGRTQNEGPMSTKQDYNPDLLFSQMYSTQVGYQDEMAQCSHCEFKEIYSQLLQDMKQDPLANQQSHGLRYRSRLLYKSHVFCRDVNTTYFACLFCAQSGVTSRNGDATVFHSANLLFRHLTRHQLPLPPVPGVNVLYNAVDLNEAGAQDYDLHFPNPELTNTLEPDDFDELDVLRPTARAIKDHINRRGEKPLDRPPVLAASGLEKEDALQFLSGARILHVEFPEKGDGKWCTGWHDGMFGAFPSKLIELEMPKGLDVANLPRSARSAVTRWKYETRGTSTAPWLKFSKGEKITSVAWDDPRAWYWSGTTNKGRSGIFPKSHIRIETVQDGSTDQPAPLKKKAASKSGLSSLFSRG